VGNALLVDASATTQPVSGTVTANAGTNLNTSALLTTTAHDAALGVAGTADAQVRTVQGIASMTPLLTTTTLVATDVDIGNVDLELAGTAVSATNPVAVRMSDGSAFVALASDLTVGTAWGTTSPGIQLQYKDFDASALPTTTNVDTELEAVPAAGSIKGVAYVMVVSEDGALERGTATTPTIAAPAAFASGGGAPVRYISAGATEDEHAVCTAACNLYSLIVTNTNAAIRYLKCENDTAAGTAPGTDTPEFSIALMATGGASYSVPVGTFFSTALTCWLVTGAADSDVAEVAANEIMVNYTIKQ
jgi:hypothetical protein